jgi:hypothetical protein
MLSLEKDDAYTWISTIFTEMEDKFLFLFWELQKYA